mmetsp:Transcript_7361/g.15022  ORF Transcript_7361/g.15022 Transcript_7361/m.15022 type:complete len:360 (-) Transcript_7361:211-1290(-)
MNHHNSGRQKLNTSNELGKHIIPQRKQKWRQAKCNTVNEQYLKDAKDTTQKAGGNVHVPPRVFDKIVFVGQNSQIQQDIGNNQNKVELARRESKHRLLKFTPRSVGDLQYVVEKDKSHGLPTGSTADRVPNFSTLLRRGFDFHIGNFAQHANGGEDHERQKGHEQNDRIGSKGCVHVGGKWCRRHETKKSIRVARGLNGSAVFGGFQFSFFGHDRVSHDVGQPVACPKQQETKRQQRNAGCIIGRVLPLAAATAIETARVTAGNVQVGKKNQHHHCSTGQEPPGEHVGFASVAKKAKVVGQESKNELEGGGQGFDAAQRGLLRFRGAQINGKDINERRRETLQQAHQQIAERDGNVFFS